MPALKSTNFPYKVKVICPLTWNRELKMPWKDFSIKFAQTKFNQNRSTTLRKHQSVLREVKVFLHHNKSWFFPISFLSSCYEKTKSHFTLWCFQHSLNSISFIMWMLTIFDRKCKSNISSPETQSRWWFYHKKNPPRKMNCCGDLFLFASICFTMMNDDAFSWTIAHQLSN